MHTKEFGALVRQLREAKGLATRELAILAGISQALVCRAESGERLPSDPKVHALAEILCEGDENTRHRLKALADSARTPGHPRPLRRRPWHLPCVPPLIGRGQLLDFLETIPNRPEPPSTLALTGPAGVGKTAAAYALARRLQPTFGDGTLVLNFHGRTPTGSPRQPYELLATALQRLGAEVSPSSSAEDLRASLHGMLHRRRMLVIADDVADSKQLRDVWPGVPTCLVIATSRDSLDATVIDGATAVDIPALIPFDGAELLRRVVDTPRARAHPDAIEHIAGACEGLPRAILAAGQYLRRHPRTPLDALARQLTAPGMLRRLHTAAGADPQASLLEAYRVSLRRVGDAAQALMQRLGDHNPHNITPDSAGDLAGIPVARAEELLDELGREHLLTPTADGWALPRLMAEYVAEGGLSLPGSRATEVTASWG